ncbi:MAG: hypothetical protein CME11_03650 [Gemmatimonadetes bacterium]|nr:hypothetical protein [Gemmatimonadota bacterium]
MGEVAASDLQVADAPGEDPPLKTILDPVILRFAVLAYLVILPVGHLVVTATYLAASLGASRS